MKKEDSVRLFWMRRLTAENAPFRFTVDGNIKRLYERNFTNEGAWRWIPVHFLFTAILAHRRRLRVCGRFYRVLRPVSCDTQWN